MLIYGATEVTPAKVYNALQTTDALGHAYREEIKPNVPIAVPGSLPAAPVIEKMFDRWI